MVVCCCVTLLCSVTLGTSFPDVCVSVWVLWCPILNSGANVLHPHSADRLKTCEGEQVNMMSDIKDDYSPREICCFSFSNFMLFTLRMKNECCIKVACPMSQYYFAQSVSRAERFQQ